MMRYLRRNLLFVLLTVFLLRPIAVHTNAQTMKFEMNVGQLGQKKASFSVGNWHKWYIRMQVPDTWEEIDSVSVFQTLSVSLELDPDSLYVRLLKENGERILLRMGEHYEVTAGSVFVEDGIADRFCVTLTQEGKHFLSEYQDADSQILIAYTARIRPSSELGVQIIGTAQLDMTDPEGERTMYLSDKAAAETGGFHISLASSAGEPIFGGRFMLAREATQKEREDASILKEHLDIGDETILAVYEKFYTTEDMETITDIASTDRAGRALCYGLAYGTYYLVQLEDNSREFLASEPLRIIINEVSHLTEEDNWKDSRGNVVDNTIPVRNTVLVMPQTGGPGVLSYTAAGSIFIICACILLWLQRKKVVHV